LQPGNVELLDALHLLNQHTPSSLGLESPSEAIHGRGLGSAQEGGDDREGADAPKQDFRTTSSILDEAASTARERFSRMFHDMPAHVPGSSHSLRASSDSDLNSVDEEVEAFSEEC
jgi:hypothetical protein